MKRKFSFVITGHEDIPNLPTRFTYKLSDIKEATGKVMVAVHYGDAKIKRKVDCFVSEELWIQVSKYFDVAFQALEWLNVNFVFSKTSSENFALADFTWHLLKRWQMEYPTMPLNEYIDIYFQRNTCLITDTLHYLLTGLKKYYH